MTASDRKNDANYCRRKGWTVGTVFTQERLSDGAGIHYWSRQYRITAIGEVSILVREVLGVGIDDRREEQWCRKLLADPVVLVAVPAHAAG